MTRSVNCDSVRMNVASRSSSLSSELGDGSPDTFSRLFEIIRTRGCVPMWIEITYMPDGNEVNMSVRDTESLDSDTGAWRTRRHGDRQRELPYTGKEPRMRFG